VTGDAPQPGETPRNESEPWTYPDPNTAWWRVEQERDEVESLADAVASRPRHPRRRPASTTPANATVRPTAYGGPDPDVDATPGFAPEAFDAHAAGVQDVTRELDRPPAAQVEAEQETRIETIEATAAAETIADTAAAQEATAESAPEPVGPDHDRRTTALDNPAQTDKGYDVGTVDESPDTPEPVEDTPPEPRDLAHPEGVPDVMVLPEPNRNRPTVALDRDGAGSARPAARAGSDQHRAVPEQPASGLSRLGEVSRERLENSPFWLGDEERAAAQAAAAAPEARRQPADAPDDTRRGRAPAKRARAARHPLPGMIGLVALAMIAAFFSWVSAEPFWLAAGHGDRGVATVGRCAGSGVTQRCSGAFAAADGSFTVERVTLLGVDPNSRTTGAVAPARMVSPDSGQAYVGSTGWMVHLRWVLGFILVVMCGYGIAGLTGARRLETPSARRGAVLISLAGPVLLLLGFLAAAV
jgi:hypothetical protein